MSCIKATGEISGEISGEASFKFDWKIDNFSSYTEEDLSLYSPDFLVLDTMFFIQVCPNGLTTHSSSGHVSLYLQVKEIEFPKTVEHRFALKTVKNTTYCEKTLLLPIFAKIIV